MTNAVTSANLRPSRWTALLVCAAAVAVAALTALVVGAPGGSRSGNGSDVVHVTASSAATAFLKEYLSSDGRVVRTDQGGDTVSEGQAYALLVAAATGDRHDFLLAWGWTQKHLQRPDGLLAWRWANGVVDAEPATDGDLGTAAALLLAGRRFSDPALVADGNRLALAIDVHEVVATRTGPVLAAGPWATGGTVAVNPSYLSPFEVDTIAAAVGGPWVALSSSADRDLVDLTAGGTLPSDWAVVGSDGEVHPSAPPGSPGASVRFGFDAARSPIWLATSCSAADRSAAAALLPALQRGSGLVDLDLGGRPSPGTAHPIGILALAAATYASGASQRAWQLVDEAARVNDEHPTYYGTAWIALTALLFGRQLYACP